MCCDTTTINPNFPKVLQATFPFVGRSQKNDQKERRGSHLHEGRGILGELAKGDRFTKRG